MAYLVIGLACLALILIVALSVFLQKDKKGEDKKNEEDSAFDANAEQVTAEEELEIKNEMEEAKQKVKAEP